MTRPNVANNEASVVWCNSLQRVFISSDTFPHPFLSRVHYICSSFPLSLSTLISISFFGCPRLLRRLMDPALGGLFARCVGLFRGHSLSSSCLIVRSSSSFSPLLRGRKDHLSPLIWNFFSPHVSILFKGKWMQLVAPFSQLFSGKIWFVFRICSIFATANEKRTASRKRANPSEGSWGRKKDVSERLK